MKWAVGGRAASPSHRGGVRARCRYRYIICADGSGSIPSRPRQPSRTSATTSRRSSRLLHEPVAIEACGNPLRSATRQPANSAVSRTMTSGCHCCDVALEIGKHRLDGATREDDAMRPAPSVRIGPWRRVGEQLLEGAGAAWEVLVAGVGDALGERGRRADRDLVAGVGEALGDRQQRVEVAGRGQARQEDPHLGQEPPHRARGTDARRAPRRSRRPARDRARTPPPPPSTGGSAQGRRPGAPDRAAPVPPSCRGTTRPAARSSRRRPWPSARVARPRRRTGPGRRPSGRDRRGEPPPVRVLGHRRQRSPTHRGRAADAGSRVAIVDSASVTSNRYQALIIASSLSPRSSMPRLMLATAAASSPSPAWADASAASGGSTAWMSPMRADVSTESRCDSARHPRTDPSTRGVGRDRARTSLPRYASAASGSMPKITGSASAQRPVTRRNSPHPERIHRSKTPSGIVRAE